MVLRRRGSAAAPAVPFCFVAVAALAVVLLASGSGGGGTGVVGVAATIVTGGSGGALWFDRERADVLGILWRNQPRASSTVEFWARVSDPLNADHAVLGFAEFDGSGAALLDNPDGMQLRFSVSRTRFYRSDAVTCSSAACRVFDAPLPGDGGGWFHWATTWDVTTGDVVFYRNGQAVASFPAQTGFFRRNLTAGGCGLIGQEPDGYAGLFDENQSFSGLLDEVRVWAGARTPQQVAAHWNTSLAALAPDHPARRDLHVYYTFDDPTETSPAGPGFVTDLSGQGNTGALGYLPNSKQWMTYATAGTKPDQFPTRPVAVHSAAPFVGDRPVKVWIDLLSAGTGPVAVANVTLAAHDHDGGGGGPLQFRVVAPPQFGTLLQVDGTTAIGTAHGSPIVDPTAPASSSAGARVRCLYTVPVTTANGASAATGAVFDSFTYNVSRADGSGGGGGASWTTQTVEVAVYPMVAQPTPRTYASDVSDTRHCVLGGTLPDTTHPLVVVTQVPVHGRLYQARFGAGGAQVYTNLVTSVADLQQSGGGGGAIDAPGTPVTSNVRGVVSYVAPPTLFLDHPELVDANGQITVTFRYAWRHRVSGVQSASATVAIVLSPTNFRPRGLAGATTVRGGAGGNATIVTLNYTDSDGAASAAPYARITGWPRFGTLYQLQPDGVSLGAALLPAAAPLPTVQSYVTVVHNVSSQVSTCAGCSQFLSCTCPDLTNGAIRLAGPEDCYPAYGDCAASFLPATKNGGAEFFEVSFATAMYVAQVQVYETLNSGTVTRVSSAPAWNGSAATPWTTQWSGRLQLNLPLAARIFSPPVCRLPFPTRAVRVDFNTRAKPGIWTAFDAVRITGTLQLPTGQVSDPRMRVVYVPRPGIRPANASAPFDSFTFRVSDCEHESADTLHTVYRAADDDDAGGDGDGGGSGARLQSAPVWHSDRTTVRSDVSALVAVPVALAAADLGVAFVAGQALVAVVGVGDGSADALAGVALHQYDPATPDRVGARIDLASAAATTGGGGGVLLSDFAGARFWVTGHSGSPSATQVFASVTLGGYAYRYALDVTVDTTVAVTAYGQPTAMDVGLWTVSALLLVVAAGCAGFVWANRSKPVIQASSPFFCVVTITGIGMAFALVLVWTPYPPTAATCLAAPWLGHVGFCLAFGALFAKTARVNRILNMAQLQRLALTDAQLFTRLLGFVAVLAGYLALWAALDTPRPTPTVVAGTARSYVLCASRNAFWPNVLLAAEAGTMGYGAYLAWSARTHPTLFNESHHIAAALYNTTVLGAIFVLLTKLVLVDNPYHVAIFECTGVLLCATVTLAALFVPKIKSVYFPNRDDLLDAHLMVQANPTKLNSPGGGGGGAGGTGGARSPGGGGYSPGAGGSPHNGGGGGNGFGRPQHGSLVALVSPKAPPLDGCTPLPPAQNGTASQRGGTGGGGAFLRAGSTVEPSPRNGTGGGSGGGVPGAVGGGGSFGTGTATPGGGGGAMSAAVVAHQQHLRKSSYLDSSVGHGTYVYPPPGRTSPAGYRPAGGTVMRVESRFSTADPSGAGDLPPPQPKPTNPALTAAVVAALGSVGKGGGGGSGQRSAGGGTFNTMVSGADPNAADGCHPNHAAPPPLPGSPHADSQPTVAVQSSPNHASAAAGGTASGKGSRKPSTGVLGVFGTSSASGPFASAAGGGGGGALSATLSPPGPSALLSSSSSPTQGSGGGESGAPSPAFPPTTTAAGADLA